MVCYNGYKGHFTITEVYLIMSGVAGRSGRKRKSPTRASALHSLTNKLPKAIEVIGDTMEGFNLDRLRYEAAISIKDSVMGKPKASTDITLDTGEGLTKAMQDSLILRLAEARSQLIEGEFTALQTLPQIEGVSSLKDGTIDPPDMDC